MPHSYGILLDLGYFLALLLVESLPAEGGYAQRGKIAQGLRETWTPQKAWV